MKKSKKNQTSFVKTALAVAVVATVSSSQAITIRHDTSTVLYEQTGARSEFDSSCNISRRNNVNHGIASASCFDDNWVILARHTLRNVENYINSSGDLAQIRPRGAESALARHQSRDRRVRVDQITYFDDDFTRFTPATDIAVSASRYSIQPIRRAVLHSSWAELNKVCYNISGANNRSDGDGNSRKAENRANTDSRDPNSVRWGGKNRIDTLANRVSAGARVLRYDFDSSRRRDPNTTGSTSPFTVESGIAGGDSGSPIFITNGSATNSIAGVLSGGSGNGYGMQTTFVRVRFFRSWVYDTLNRSRY